jgi:hypothetical protein
MKMLKMLKPPNLNIFGIFAKAPKVLRASSEDAHEDAHPEHLRLTIYYFERKIERTGRRCSPPMGLTRARACAGLDPAAR